MIIIAYDRSDNISKLNGICMFYLYTHTEYFSQSRAHTQKGLILLSLRTKKKKKIRQDK